MSLIEKYSGYMPLTEDKINAIWADSIIILDTSVLLSLYRVNDTAKSQMLAVLQELKDRLWMPNHVALEYSRNRVHVAKKSRNIYASLRSTLNKTAIDIENLDKNLMTKEAKTELVKIVRESLSAANDYVKSIESAHSDNSKNDAILPEIDVLFGSNIGTGHAPSELPGIYEEGAARYAKSIPPGFGDDREKPEPEKYGDLVIWYEVIDQANAAGKNVIFVTDDRKPDWFSTLEGSRLIARPELLQEFKVKSQQECLIYPSEEFFKIASTFTHKEISGETETEIERSSSQNQTDIGQSLDTDDDSILSNAFRGNTEDIIWFTDFVERSIDDVENSLAGNKVTAEDARTHIRHLEFSKDKLLQKFSLLMDIRPHYPHKQAEITSNHMKIADTLTRLNKTLNTLKSLGLLNE